MREHWFAPAPLANGPFLHADALDWAPTDAVYAMAMAAPGAWINAYLRSTGFFNRMEFMGVSAMLQQQYGISMPERMLDDVTYMRAMIRDDPLGALSLVVELTISEPTRQSILTAIGNGATPGLTIVPTATGITFHTAGAAATIPTAMAVWSDAHPLQAARAKIRWDGTLFASVSRSNRLWQLIATNFEKLRTLASDLGTSPALGYDEIAVRMGTVEGTSEGLLGGPCTTIIMTYALMSLPQMRDVLLSNGANRYRELQDAQRAKQRRVAPVVPEETAP
jgi:hypothetical protein